jgi:hypothetical protein
LWFAEKISFHVLASRPDLELAVTELAQN